MTSADGAVVLAADGSCALRRGPHPEAPWPDRCALSFPAPATMCGERSQALQLAMRGTGVTSRAFCQERQATEDRVRGWWRDPSGTPTMQKSPTGQAAVTQRSATGQPEVRCRIPLYIALGTCEDRNTRYPPADTGRQDALALATRKWTVAEKGQTRRFLQGPDGPALLQPKAGPVDQPGSCGGARRSQPLGVCSERPCLDG